MTLRYLTGNAIVCGVVGDPVAHSLSPDLHNFWLEKHRVDGVYIPLHVHHAHFRKLFPRLPEMGMRGCNITIPYKEEVLEFVDELEPVAEAIGAVNTVEFRNGRVVGTNTDAYGFWKSLEKYGDWRAAAKRALVLGAGGASRAVIYALKKEGVEVFVANRTLARSRQVARRFEAEVVPWEKAEGFLKEVTMLVNTTSLGMEGQPEMGLSLNRLSKEALVADVVYHPLETRLLAEAKSRGCRTVNGLGMLAFQAREGFRRWYGVQPEVDEEVMLRLKQQLEKRR